MQQVRLAQLSKTDIIMKAFDINYTDESYITALH